MRLRRAIRRLLLGLVLLLALAAAAVAVLWQLGLRALATESRMADTARGPVEYAAFGDPERPPLLLVHGSPGGYDQLVPLARQLAASGYRAVTVSRPGYLRTPQSVGRTPEEQADALAGLLGALDLGPVVVVGISGGGPATLQLALRHPAKVRAVILLGAVTLRFRDGEPDPAQVTEFGLGWDLGGLAGRWFPSLGLRLLGVSDGRERQQLLADPATRETVRYLFQSLGFSAHRRGYVNDTLTVDWNDLEYPLETIAVPVLLLHGSEDTNVPLAHSLKVAERAPHADLRVLEGGGHTFFVLQREWMEEQILQFLQTLEPTVP